MNKHIVFAVFMFAAAIASAVEFKWTGAVSSDFADAGNWLVKSGDEWVTTNAPPANLLCKDDVVFEGDASLCDNMPVINENYALYRIYFRTGGWSLTVNEGFSLALVHGSGGWGQGDEQGYGDANSIIDTSENGKTNVVSGTLAYRPGCSFQVSDGSVLRLDVALALTGTGYNGQQRQVRFNGDGTVVLTKAGFPSSASSFHVNGTTIVMDVPDGNAISGKPLYLKGGRLKSLRSGQLGVGQIYLSGDACIDFGGFYYDGELCFGAESSSVSAEWTGSLLNLGDLKMGSNNSGYLVSPKSPQIVIDSKVDGHSKWQSNGEGNKIRVGDIPGVVEELVFNGPLCGNVKNKYGCSVYFNGLEMDDKTTYGSVSLNAATDFGGIYTRVIVSTVLFVNSTAEVGSSLGKPLKVEVKSDTGILRGDGVISPFADNAEKRPTIDVYGTLSPGSVANPAGTLAFNRSGSKTDITVTMHTNSTFRIEADVDGMCPKVVQETGTLITSDA